MRALTSGFAFALAFAVVFPSAVAKSQQHDGSYYCVAEFSGGIAYNEALKKWEGVRFRPSHKFVVRFKYAGPHKEADGIQSYGDDYFVTITPSGSDKAEACQDSKRSDRIEFTSDGVRGDCGVFPRRYIFNLKHKRFQATFEAADYVIGSDDKNSDTASISGGTCTKIQ